ncbi:hypothetical protein EDE15_0020 [Edaphobacter aggregans]|jgi:uncharacterized membrane protein|uniref:DoxX-like protein n=1 Tax=Edaphobacter aggregans TaxID=570835 RepID=A0A3R9NVE6_9BACT|nr:hypothetical protein [Edaphobacter aggregans]RSL14568.1 hypothetical protein EDE15_0020 [Edaphobacter aggregans]
MSVEVWGMLAAGIAALVAGLVLVQPRFRAACGADKVIVLGPPFEAVALAIFAAEHFLAARDLMPIVPRWLPGPLFWTYFFGVALLAAAVSFIIWRYVRWSALLLALFFLLIVVTVDLPNLPPRLHERLFWTLTARETAFGAGAMVLSGSLWPRGSLVGTMLMRLGRVFVGATMIFYAIQHFLFPQFVPGVPLEKMIPAWVPAPTLLSYFMGTTLLLAGIGLLVPRTIRVAAASSGMVLLLLTAFFYVPILVMEIHTPLAVEGINYVGDTLLFAATVLLAGFGADLPKN